MNVGKMIRAKVKTNTQKTINKAIFAQILEL
jgi:hypothetical protein